ncbi:hypothetical protein NE865_13978 [Phthorimaea operculella]|nr:hypothetical protein NE865_13978 [Phthorimaea operculella]
MPMDCSSCGKTILTTFYLRCKECTKTYDLDCIQMKKESFLALKKIQKETWYCSSCACANPQTVVENLNVPNSPLQARLSSADTVNVNMTRGSGGGKLKTDLPTPPASQTNALTKDDIRSILKEEIEILKVSLLAELEATLKKRLMLEIKVIDDKNIEQNNRSCNLEIQCVPEHKNENIPTIIKQLSKSVNCELQDSDIHNYTRVAKMNKDDSRPRSIVVKLAAPRIRDTLLASVSRYNRANANDKLNTSHIGFGGDKKPIYVMEHLSPANRALHAAARRKSKVLNYKFVWVKNGKIFMRKNESSDYIYVKDQASLDKLA